MDTKALRQKILDLAIRGKLVPQDPNDEPASVLLERIRAEKQQMVKDGKLKAKDIKNDTVIFKGDDNLHYEKYGESLPNGWVVTNFGTLLAYEQPTKYIVNDTNYKPTYKTPVLTAGKSFILGYTNETDNIFYDLPVIIFDDFTTESKFVDFPFKVKSSAMKILHINQDLVLPKYAFYLMQATEIDHDNHQRYWISTYSQEIISLPPLSEQIKIIEAVENLFDLTQSVETNSQNLKNSIKSIKSKILDLAIRGKLVPQDPNDEPASVLLERIRAEKEELIKQGKIKRDKKESVIFKGDDNSYYLRTDKLIESLDDWHFDELPDNWSLCCLGEICDYGNCINVDSSSIAESAWILDLEDIEKDTGIVLKKIKKSGRNAASTKHLFHKGQVLYSKLRPYLNKVVLADEDGYCTSEILPLDFSEIIVPEYARYFLMSPTFLRYANKCSYGVKMPRLGTTDGKKAILSLPPIEEQKRIVFAIEKAFSSLSSITENLS